MVTLGGLGENPHAIHENIHPHTHRPHTHMHIRHAHIHYTCTLHMATTHACTHMHMPTYTCMHATHAHAHIHMHAHHTCTCPHTHACTPHMHIHIHTPRPSAANLAQVRGPAAGTRADLAQSHGMSPLRALVEEGLHPHLRDWAICRWTMHEEGLQKFWQNPPEVGKMGKGGSRGESK